MTAPAHCSASCPSPPPGEPQDVTHGQVVLKQDQQFLHRTRNPIRLVDHQQVAGLHSIEGGPWLGAVPVGAAGFDDDLAAIGIV